MRPTALRSTRVAIAVTVAAASAITLAACAGQDPTQPPSATAAEPLHIGLFVSDAFGDHSFFDAAATAIDPLQSQYNAVVTKYEGKLDVGSFPQTLQDAADTNQLVFVLGNQALDAESQAAAQNPDTTFVFVNGTSPDPNIISATFKNEESCYLGGAAAGLINKAAGKDTIGFVAGFTVPAIQDCEAGYKQGAELTNPGLKEISQVVGSFSDPNKGLEVAQAEAQQGAYSIYGIAGLSNQGIAKAAEQGSKIAPILADSAPGDSVAATVQDHTDVMLLDITKQYVAGSLKKGDVIYYGFKEGAFTASYNSSFLSQADQDTLKGIQEKLVSGELVAKPAAH